MNLGYRPDDILSAYEARDEAAAQIPNRYGSISIVAILKAIKTFPSLAEDDSIGEAIVSIWRATSKVKSGIFIDTTLVSICEAADYYDLADHRAALMAYLKPSWSDSDDEEALQPMELFEVDDE